jgi:hypothetical protein
MKLKIIKTFQLANPKTMQAPWFLKEGEVIDTDDTYLIVRLKELNAAEEVNAKSSQPTMNKARTPEINKAVKQKVDKKAK